MVYNKWHKTKDGRPVLVRNAVAADAEIVHKLNVQSYLDSPFLSMGPDDDWDDDSEGTRSYIEDLLPTEREAFLVAEIDSQIIADAHLDGCGDRKKMLHRCDISLGVQKDFRNQGVGHCLMEALIALAQKAGYEQIELNVIEDNLPGVFLYQSYGFQRTGKIPHAYKYPNGSYGDFLTMILFLQDEE